MEKEVESYYTENNNEYRLSSKKRVIMKKGGWECNKCTKINSANDEYCTCGMTKIEILKIDDMIERQNRNGVYMR